jgi:hypothetical protein
MNSVPKPLSFQYVLSILLKKRIQFMVIPKRQKTETSQALFLNFFCGNSQQHTTGG